ALTGRCQDDSRVSDISFACHWRDQRIGAVGIARDYVTDSYIAAIFDLSLAFAKLEGDSFFVMRSDLHNVAVAFFPDVGNTGNIGEVRLTFRVTYLEQLFNAAEALSCVVRQAGAGTVLGVEA